MASTLELEQLSVLAESADFDLKKVAAKAASIGISVMQLFDELSLHVAKLYDNGQLDYKQADRIMNCVWGAIFSQPAEQIEIPDITRDIYEAFDVGEYFHQEDLPDTDPEFKYTRPLVKQALLKYGSQKA